MPPLYLTFALMLCCFTSITAARVMVSLYALSLGAAPFAVGILFAAFYAFPLLLSWPAGRLADRFGSRWLLLFGASTGACGMLLPYFFHAMPALYVAATTMGLAFTFYNVLLQNLIGLISKPAERTRNFSNSSIVGATTLLTGPLIAGWSIDYAGPAVACLYAVALSLAATAMLLLWGKALPGGGAHAAPAVSVRSTLKDPAIVKILITSSLVQVGQDMYQFYMPVYGHSIGLSASAIGTVLAGFAGAYFVVRFVMPHLIARFGEERLLACAFYLAATGFLLMPIFRNVVSLAVVSFMFGLGMGCGQPITTMLLFNRTPEGRSGETFGLRQTTNNILRVTMPSVFGFIASVFGLLPVFCLSALLMAAGGEITRRKPADRKGGGSTS
jgi:MFS family permease